MQGSKHNTMSTTFADFISTWNESMPIQIRESDIKNPSEQTFRRLLIALLKTLNVDTSFFENMESEGGNALRASRVRLIANTNYFYKIANPDVKKRHDLVFMDLIQPSFKKVFNTLNYLVNYSVYVSLRYKETVLDINERLKERDELRTLKNQMRKANEEAKIKHENNQKEIRGLDDKIHRQKLKVDELMQEQELLKSKTAKVTEKSEKTEMDIVEIRNDLDLVKNAAMSREEIESIIAAKANVLQRLEEQNQLAAAVRQKIKENSQKIEEVQEITSKMEALTSAFNIDPKKIKSLKEQVGKFEANISKLKADIPKRHEEVNLITQALSAKKNEIEFKTRKLDEANKSFTIKEAEQMKELKETESLLRKLKAQEAVLGGTYKRLRQKQQQMFQIASNVVKHISTKMMDDEDTEN